MYNYRQDFLNTSNILKKYFIDKNNQFILQYKKNFFHRFFFLSDRQLLGEESDVITSFKLT